MRFIFLMHGDTTTDEDLDNWNIYIEALKARDAFEGGSSLGHGTCYRKQDTPPEASNHITGYIKVRAHNLVAAKLLLNGNPTFEAGGSVEIRPLVED